MMNAKQMEAAAKILENFEGDTRELPESFVRLGVIITCPETPEGDELFNVAVDYLVTLGVLKSSVGGWKGNYFPTLRNA